MKIFIDPGHGGIETGAISITGVPEKTINLGVSLELKKLLLTVPTVHVKLSRETDVALSLTERANMANNWGADICISIHHNGGGGDGYEVIHSIKHGIGEQVAKVIAEEFQKLGQNAHWKGVYDRESENYPGHDYYSMIARPYMPAIITEFAFMDTKDFYIIDTPAEQQKEAQAIFNALVRYYYLPVNKKHWGEEYYNKLINAGMKLDKPEFDKTITKAELYAFGWKLLDLLK